MTRSEATQELIDLFMWGEKYMGVNLAYVMDGEPMDECLQLIAERRHNDALDWLRPFVKKFMEGETGEKLIDEYIRDDRERRRDNAIDAKRELQEA